MTLVESSRIFSFEAVFSEIHLWLSSPGIRLSEIEGAVEIAAGELGKGSWGD